MQLLPHRRLAPFRAAVRTRVLRVGLVEEAYVVVCGHFPDDSRRRHRAFRVHVAPPVDGLHAAQVAQAPVVAQHVPQPGVHPALDAVVGPGQRPLRRQGRVQVGEQGALVHERRQRRPGPPEPLVGVHGSPVHHRPLLQEVRPEAAPLHVPLHPPVGLAQVVKAHQLPRQPVELYSRLQPRAGRGMPLDLAERMEQAPLDPGLGPFRGDRGREPAAAVGHHDLGRRDPRQQRAPCAGRLGLGHVPRQHVRVAARYEHHELPGHVDAVDVDDAVDLVHDLGHGPDPPELLGPAPEGAAAARHGRLPALRQQPAQERLELLGLCVSQDLFLGFHKNFFSGFTKFVV